MTDETPDAGGQELKTLDKAACGIIAFAIVPCVAVLGFALARLNTDLSLAQIVTFYVVPSIVAFALASSFRLSSDKRGKVALLLVAICFSLVAAETTLVLLPGMQMSRFGAQAGFEVVKDLRAAGDHAFPTVPGGVLVAQNIEFTYGASSVHPITPAPGLSTAVLCYEDNFVAYRGDRFGFNNPDEEWDSEEIDVILIGDSYTAGMCVEPDNQIANHLRSRWRTLNLGARGAGPLQELVIIREYAASKTPPVVVWIYYEGNDLYDMRLERGHQWLVDYLDPTHTQDLMSQQDAIDTRYRAWLDSLLQDGLETADMGALPSLLRRLREVPRFRSVRRLIGFGVLTPTETPPLGVVPHALERARGDVAAWGGQLILVYMPAYERYTTFIGEGLRGRRELIAFAESSGIPLVNLDPILRATGDPKSLWAGPRDHLNPRGYRLAAVAISDAIAESLLRRDADAPISSSDTT